MGRRVKVNRQRWWILALALCFSTGAWAEQATIDAFFGDYVGHAQIANGDDRDLSVSIRPKKHDQFAVRWTTVTHKEDGSLKRKVYDIRFTPTDRPFIFASAMKTNVFGGKVPLDPMNGDPFVWARIKDKTLTVNALLINDDGSFEIQVYDRTLNEKGVLLDFTRSRHGEELKHIKTQLVRVAD